MDAADGIKRAFYKLSCERTWRTTQDCSLATRPHTQRSLCSGDWNHLALTPAVPGSGSRRKAGALSKLRYARVASCSRGRVSVKQLRHTIQHTRSQIPAKM